MKKQNIAHTLECCSALKRKEIISQATTWVKLEDIPLLLLLVTQGSILCDPMDFVTCHGILQVRILEWVAIPFSRDRTCISCITGRFFTTEPPGKTISEISQSHQDECCLISTYMRDLK